MSRNASFSMVLIRLIFNKIIKCLRLDPPPAKKILNEFNYNYLVYFRSENITNSAYKYIQNTYLISLPSIYKYDEYFLNVLGATISSHTLL